MLLEMLLRCIHQTKGYKQAFCSRFSLSDTNLKLYRKTESYFSSHQISKQFSAIRELCVVEYNIIKPEPDILLSLNYPSKSA